MPFYNKILSVNDIVQGQFARQIGGCASLETACQMLSGKHSSLLEPHGMGRILWQDKVKDLSKSTGPLLDRPKEAFPEWNWIEETLPLILFKKGYKCEALNPFVISGCFGYMRYPEFYRHIEIPVSNYEANCDYVNRIQSNQEDMLYFINYGSAHEAVDISSSLEDMNEKIDRGLEMILKILRNWDFSEPDTLFWIYSDHGPWRWPYLGIYPEPRNFITWIVLKDNIYPSIRLKLKLVSATDFYSTVLSKFGMIEKTINENRIYFTEDGRDYVSCKENSTAIACELKNNNLNYLMYNEARNEFFQRSCSFFEKGYKLSSYVEIKENFDEHLLSALRTNFGWIK
jgi:hypothetical protein